MLETPDAIDKVLAYYKQNLAGFTQEADMNMAGQHMQKYSNAQYDVALVIASMPVIWRSRNRMRWPPC